MNKTLACMFATAALTTSGLAFADRPGQDWIPIEKAIETAKGAGYTVITEIEADDDHWEGAGYKNDEKHEFKIDGKSGQIVKDERDMF